MSMINFLKDFFEGLNSQLSSVNRQVNKVSYNVERNVEKHVKKIKKEIVSLFLFITFVFITIVFLLLGTIVFLNKFAELEIILLIFGVLFALLSIIVKATN